MAREGMSSGDQNLPTRGSSRIDQGDEEVAGGGQGWLSASSAGRSSNGVGGDLSIGEPEHGLLGAQRVRLVYRDGAGFQRALACCAGGRPRRLPPRRGVADLRRP